MIDVIIVLVLFFGLIGLIIRSIKNEIKQEKILKEIAEKEAKEFVELENKKPKYQLRVLTKKHQVGLVSSVIDAKAHTRYWLNGKYTVVKYTSKELAETEQKNVIKNGYFKTVDGRVFPVSEIEQISIEVNNV